MERLAQRDLESFLSCLREIYAHSDLEAFAPRVLSALPKAVPLDSASYNEIDLLSGKTLALVTDLPASGYASEAERVFQRHLHEHPIIGHYQRTRDGRALKVSDFLTPSQWHRLRLYNEFYKEIRGVEHQMLTILPAPAPLVIAFALNRGGKEDFSERDRLLLDLLRPHLVQAHRNAEALTQTRRESDLLMRAVEGSERGVISLSGKDRVRWLTEQARRWLSEYFEPAPQPDRLPENLARWVEHQRFLLSGGIDSVPPPREPLTVKRAGGKRLVARLVTDSPEEDSCLLLLEERHAPLSAGPLETLGLTSREAEVLLGVARGKTNKEVAEVLYVSPLTVKKHLENAYRKLGAEGRTEAVSRVLELLGLIHG